MPKKELNQQEEIEEVVNQVHQALIEKLRVSKLGLEIRKKETKSHYDYQKAIERLEAVKRQYTFA